MTKDGFSIMTVMIGAIVVASLAVVFMQKAKNKARVAAITDIIAYRDYVFRYYHEVAANRMAWQCTLNANTSLKNYVRGVGGPTGPHNLWLHDVSGTGCVVGGGTGEERITGSGIGTAQGRGLKLYTDPYDTSVETYDPDNVDHEIRVYTTWEGLGQNRVRIRLAAAYNYRHDEALTSFKIKEKETFIYMGRTPARNCGESIAIFYDDRGTGSNAPRRYFGDTAISSLDAETRLVTCWEDGPLVIPPCFDLLERGGVDYSFDPSCPSLGTDKNTNYAGMCPNRVSAKIKVPAISGFVITTGKTICEEKYALVLGDRLSTGSPWKDRCSDSVTDDRNAIVGVAGVAGGNGKEAHRPICSVPRARFGIIGGRQPRGIKGWTKAGSVEDAGDIVGKPGLRGKQGHPGVLPPPAGPKGREESCSCTCPSPTCSVNSDCDTTGVDADGNTITIAGTCSNPIPSLCPSYRRC